MSPASAGSAIQMNEKRWKFYPIPKRIRTCVCMRSVGHSLSVGHARRPDIIIAYSILYFVDMDCEWGIVPFFPSALDLCPWLSISLAK